MFQRLEEIERRFRVIEEGLADPELTQRPQEYQRLAKEHSDLSVLVESFRAYRRNFFIVIEIFGDPEAANTTHKVI